MDHIEMDLEEVNQELSSQGIPPSQRRAVLEGMEWIDNLYSDLSR